MPILKLLSKRQEAELVTAIQGRAEIPLKFAYLGEGAYNWDRIARQRSEGKGINSAETALLKKKVGDFLAAVDTQKGINIIDIGCGNGRPVLPILERLKEKNIHFTYVPLDISNEMIELASGTIKKRFPGTKCKPVQMDFELGQFSDITYDLKDSGGTNLMLFLGSTLGNHSDLNRVLTNFRDSMTSRDFLIIGVELTNLAKVSSIVPHYTNTVVKKLLLEIPRELGISGSAYTYEALWNEKYSQIECRIIFKKPVKVKIAGEHFTLEKNENMLVARSIKFTEYTATKLFSDVGFRTELLTTAEDRGYLLTMIQPTRYSA
ncbi:MAG: L-histidine N(alpha)-methyltransferase [Patescibacteria group bacterium]|nr:L-histidine N(alpha)-methyltransferase [Patescibacteria group bacterium]